MSGKKMAIPIDRNIKPVSAGRPGMGFVDLMKWWFSPFYYQELDGKRFYFKKYKENYYLVIDKKFGRKQNEKTI
jgi:hypothetical protein